ALAGAEAAEAANLNLVAGAQRTHNAVENGFDNDFAVFAGHFRQPRDFIDQVRFCHSLFRSLIARPFQIEDFRLQIDREPLSIRNLKSAIYDGPQVFRPPCLPITFSNIRAYCKTQARPVSALAGPRRLIASFRNPALSLGGRGSCVQILTCSTPNPSLRPKNGFAQDDASTEAVCPGYCPLYFHR